jgi:uroporphyrinogen-III decarboxylase
MTSQERVLSAFARQQPDRVPVNYFANPETDRRLLNIMMPGGGYCFAPTHELQDNSPTENIVAMYRTAQEFGRY